MGCEPWLLSRDRARLGSGTAGIQDSSCRQEGCGCGGDGRILETPYLCFGFCRRVAQWGEIRKKPPKGRHNKPISYYRKVQ